MKIGWQFFMRTSTKNMPSFCVLCINNVYNVYAKCMIVCVRSTPSIYYAMGVHGFLIL